MVTKVRPALVGRRFLSLAGELSPKLWRVSEWKWRGGVIRAATSVDPQEQDLQLLLEFDCESWKDRDWYYIYKPEIDEESSSNGEDKKKEKAEKRTKRKISSDSESGENIDFQIFLVEDRLVLAPRSTAVSQKLESRGNLYPALVFKSLVDKLDLFTRTKKLPLEFLSNGNNSKLDYQDYAKLKTILKWDPSIPGLAVCHRSENEVCRWGEERECQHILSNPLSLPDHLIGYRVSIYRVEGTTQWYTAVIIGYNKETQEFTVTDDTVLEVHYENPALVQMKLIGEGVVESILGGESATGAPRRSRSSVYRGPARPRVTERRGGGRKGSRLKERRTSQTNNSGKRRPKNRRHSQLQERATRRKSSDNTRINSKTEQNQQDSLVVPEVIASNETSYSSIDQKSSETCEKSSGSQFKPVRLPVGSGSESDSDSKSSKSSSSATTKANRVFKKAFKGKAVAIVKPFSNAPSGGGENKKKKEESEDRPLADLYEFQSDEDKSDPIVAAVKKCDNHHLVKLKSQTQKTFSQVNSSIKHATAEGKRLKPGIKPSFLSVKGKPSFQRIRGTSGLKSVRVRVKKLRNSGGKNSLCSSGTSSPATLPETTGSDSELRENSQTSETSETSETCETSPQESEKEETADSPSTFSSETSTSSNNNKDPTCNNNQEEVLKVSVSEENRLSETTVVRTTGVDNDKSSAVEGESYYKIPQSRQESLQCGAAAAIKVEDGDNELDRSGKEVAANSQVSEKQLVNNIKSKSDEKRNEESDNTKNRSRMEDDNRSDSGVSTLRSDGARSSGDERSGSRSSAISDDRSGSHPSASASTEPDIKIVGESLGSHRPLQGDPRDRRQAHSPAPRREGEGRHAHSPAGHAHNRHSLVLDKRDPVKVWRDPGLVQRDQEVRHLQQVHNNHQRNMADPRQHPLGLPPTSLPGLSANLSSAANLHALAAHYPPGMLVAAGAQLSGHASSLGGHAASLASHASSLAASLPPHLQGLPPGISPQTLLQYQQIAAATGLPADVVFKQYGGLPLPGPHPPTDLLLERERQIAQERDRALRERRDLQQRESERLEKERSARDRQEKEERDKRERERMERDRMERERAMEQQRREKDAADRRQREAEAAVNKHFEESMEMARRNPLQAQFLLNVNQKLGGAASNWSGLPGIKSEMDQAVRIKAEMELQDRRRLEEQRFIAERQRQDIDSRRHLLSRTDPAYSRAPPAAHGPPPAHGGSAKSPSSFGSAYPGQHPRSGHKAESNPHARSVVSPKHYPNAPPGAPPGFRTVESYGPGGRQAQAPSPSHHRGPSPHHRGPSPHHRGPSPHTSHHQLDPAKRGGPSPHHAPGVPPLEPAKRGGPSPHQTLHSPPDRYPSYSPKLGYPAPSTKSSHPGYSHLQPHQALPSNNISRPVGSSPVPSAHSAMYGLPKAPLPSPTAAHSSGPPPAHGAHPAHRPLSSISPSTWPPPHQLASPGGQTNLSRSQPLTVASVNGNDAVPLDLGPMKRKTPNDSVIELHDLPQKSARLETVSPPGQLYKVTEPSTLGVGAVAAAATTITTVVNTAAINATSLSTTTTSPPTTASVSGSETPTTSHPPPSTSPATSTTSEQSKPAQDAPPEQPFQYVHKLKRAWMIKSAAVVPETQPSNGTSTTSSSTSNSNVTSPQLTRATPSPAGSTKSCGSSKGFPKAVKSTVGSLPINGHGSPGGSVKKEEDEMSSSDNEETTKQPLPKQKKMRGKPGPKPKNKPGPKPKTTPRKKHHNSESENNSESEKDSDSSKASKKSEVVIRKKRGRKPGPKSKNKDKDVDEPKTKKIKSEENKSEPFARPPISQLKKTGDSFLQDASCFEVAPKLNKCRECRWSHAQRQKQQTIANIFCRFYAFRRLRYTKNGQIAPAGFCDPKVDAQIEDLKLWLPSQELSPTNMDKETAKIILQNLSKQFTTIYKQEQEAAHIHLSEDLTVAWKRVVQGVREMCDVCEATLFNKHWACGKCGFVVCIDCYRTRANGPPPHQDDQESSAKDKDDYQWLLCTNRQSHQQDAMMLTQIIAGDALDEVSSKLKILAKLRKANGFAVNGWEKPDTNGVKKEEDIKEEEEEQENDDSSTLRDLLSGDSKKENGDSDDCSWTMPDMEPRSMSQEESEGMYPGVDHSWHCGGAVLRFNESKEKGVIGLFKFMWKRSQPVIFSQRLSSKLWVAGSFADLPDPPSDNPDTPVASSVSHGQTIGNFFAGFDSESRRAVSDDGAPLALKLSNCPSAEDQFLELLPNHYKDFMSNLPLSEYTNREGILNLASRLPDCFVRLDLGPRLWGAYVGAHFNMQYSVSDAMHVMVVNHQGKEKDKDVLQALESIGCDQKELKRAKENPGSVGAVWQVFHPSDAKKIKAFINKNTKSSDAKSKDSTKTKDPLYEQTMYLKERLLSKLSDEEGLKPWTFCQSVGEGVMIPAGAPYQVTLVTNAVLVQTEFVSPEHMAQSVQLSHADVQQFEDRLQVKNLVFHSCKDALSVLEKPDTKKEEK